MEQVKKYIVALYSLTGKFIKEWQGTGEVDIGDDWCRFLNNKGKEVSITGKYIVECEEK